MFKNNDPKLEKDIKQVFLFLIFKIIYLKQRSLKNWYAGFNLPLNVRFES